MFERLLVALDGSFFADRVLDEAIDLAKAIDCKVMLLHVLSSEEEGAPQPTSIDLGRARLSGSRDLLTAFRESWKQYEQACLQRLIRYADYAKSKGIDVEWTQQPGSAGRLICDIATVWHADLIMMGRHGRVGLNELLMGSVSNYVTHHAGCAVLLIGQSSDNNEDNSDRTARTANRAATMSASKA